MSRALAFATLLAASFATVSGDALAQGSTSPSAATVAPWGKLLVSGPGGVATEVAILSVAKDNTAGARPETTWINDKTERFWIARKGVKTGSAPAAVQWADSRSCTAMVETLVTLADLDAPTPPPAGTVMQTRQDGTIYGVEAPGLRPGAPGGSEAHLTNDAVRPASAVVEDALKAWAPCWSDTPPKLD